MAAHSTVALALHEAGDFLVWTLQGLEGVYRPYNLPYTLWLMVVVTG